MPLIELGKENYCCVQLASSVPLVLLVPLGPGFAGLFRADADAVRSLVLSKLWKKF